MCGRRVPAGEREGEEDEETSHHLLESPAPAAEPAVPAHPVPGTP